MEGQYNANKTSVKPKHTVGLKEVLKIVESGFKREQIKSTFNCDYDDIFSSDDERSSADSTSSQDTAENRLKTTEIPKNNTSIKSSTCTKHEHQHVQ